VTGTTRCNGVLDMKFSVTLSTWLVLVGLVRKASLMKNIAFILAMILCSCGRTGSIPDISNVQDLRPFVGQTVKLTGVVSRDKCPQIHGVDLWHLAKYSGKSVTVTGKLKSYRVTDEDVKKMDEEVIAHRGAGLFFEIDSPIVDSHD
jgi:hypothetical protein